MKSNKKLFKDIVLRFAEESKCESYKVACVAVKDNRIIASGVNGTLPGKVNCKEYMKIIKFPQSNFKGTYEEWKKTDEWRKIHHEFSEIEEAHSEQQVIIQAARSTISLKDCDIFVTHMPCVQCAKLLAFIEPRIIYYIYDYDKADVDSIRLLKNMEISLERI